jgi:hypothetical protein
MREKEIHHGLPNPALRCFSLPECILKYVPIFLHEDFFVFTFSGGSEEHVIPDQVHRRERLPTSVQSRKDHLRVVFLRQGDDDEMKILEYRICECEQAIPCVRRILIDECLRMIEKKPIAGDAVWSATLDFSILVEVLWVLSAN